MQIDLPLAALMCLISSVLTLGGFYFLTNWRLKQLEDDHEMIADIRERLVRIETTLSGLKKRN